MRSVRTTLKIAPKTHDEEYDARRKALKDLNSALGSYKSSMEKVKSNVKSAIESLTRIKEVYQKMTESEETPGATRDLVLQFDATVNRITGDLLAQYTQSMDTDVIPAVLDMKKLYDECHHLETERNKLMKEYDVYRNEVAKKEAEYAKKNKDLTTSKSYGSDVIKRNDYQAKFEEADTKFKDSHDYLVSNSARTTNRCMVTFFQCSFTFLNSLGEEFKALYDTALHVSQEVAPAMQPDVRDGENE